MELMLFGKCIYVSKAMLALAVVIAALLIGTAGFIISRNQADIIFEATIVDEGTSEALGTAGTPGIETEDDSVAGASSGGETVMAATTSTEGEPGKTETIKVYVVGCVKSPGIVTLRKGQLIDDAIKAAGGPTEDADLENINLVYELNDNVMLRVKSKKENLQISDSSKQNSTADASYAGKGAVIVKDSGGALVDESVSGVKAGGKININTASVDELDTLPYIGKETAKDIIAYREANGKFKAIEDIMKVPGIKEARFGKIKDLICVD